jgi:hypothetical protein
MDEHFQESAEQGASEIQSEVDLSLIDINLRLSVEERIQKHDEAAQLVEDLLKAGEAWRRGQSR